MQEKEKDEIAMTLIADLWTKDIIELIIDGRHKEALNIGVKMGLTKVYIKEIIKDYKEAIKEE